MSILLSMWAFLCAAAPSVSLPNINDSIINHYDTIECLLPSQILEELVVTASPVTDKSDRKILRPDKETLRISSDGMDLLRRLHLSRITVNPLTNSVSVAGGGNVVFCINGVEATGTQIAAVNPKDIVKIEYHDNPGVRYSDAEVVIDYITVHREDGGGVAFDTFGAYAQGRWAAIGHISGQYNHEQSTWSVNAGYMGQRKDKWLRDYDEVWHYPDVPVIRHEDGLPVTVGQSGFEGSVNYNYLRPSGDLLNVRIGLSVNDVPDKEEGDRHAILQTSDSETTVTVMEHTEEHSTSPDVGLYYKHILSDNGNLIFDVQGSYMHSRMLHEYCENDVSEINKVSGNKYSMKALAMHEYHKDNLVLKTLVSNNSSVIANTYHQSHDATVRINRSETAVAEEFTGNFGNWDVVGGVRFVYSHMGYDSGKIDRLFVLPSATVTWHPGGGWFMRYSASLDHTMPAAAEICDIVQPIQTGMVRIGNPGLHPFRTVGQTFDISFESELISVSPRIDYRYEHRPIMESVIYEQGQFVRTYFNQRSFQRLIAGGMVVFRPWRNHLTLSAEPLLTRYFSHGIDYHHCHNIFRLALGMDFNYGNWLAYANIMSGPANKMYGEEIIEEKDMNQIMVGYNGGLWSLHIGVFNAFMKNYWMETRNLSALAPYSSKAHGMRSNSYFAIKLSLSLDYGHKRQDVELRDREIDYDNGILPGTK